MSRRGRSRAARLASWLIDLILITFALVTWLSMIEPTAEPPRPTTVEAR